MSLICAPVFWKAKAQGKKKPLQHSFLIDYLYITGLQNERQFHLIYCLTELKLDPKENNMTEMKSTFPFSTPIVVVDSMTKEVVFYSKLQGNSWKTFQTEFQIAFHGNVVCSAVIHNCYHKCETMSELSWKGSSLFLMLVCVLHNQIFTIPPLQFPSCKDILTTCQFFWNKNPFM